MSSRAAWLWNHFAQRGATSFEEDRHSTLGILTSLAMPISVHHTIPTGRVMLEHFRKLTPLVLLFVVGCGGGGPVPVAGQVTLDGQPVTGHIVFVPNSNDGPKRGGAIENGRYDIPKEKGPVPGAYRVEIYSQRKTGRVIKGPDAEQSGVETTEAIPEKYNRATTLSATLTAGPNQIDFALTTP
jgi:hypothetical protein